MLELFKGTGSVGRVFALNDYRVISVDSAERWKATHTVDILKFRYRRYRPGYFRYIWASPPCTQYSQARTTGPPPDYESADAIVARTIRIIKYLRPRFWFIENPAGGELRNRPVMKTLPHPHRNVVLDYCQFSNWGYRKPTCVWYGGYSRQARVRVIHPVRCPRTLRGCRNMERHSDGRILHRVHLSGNTDRPGATKYRKYRVPTRLVQYVTGLPRVPRDSD